MFSYCKITFGLKQGQDVLNHPVIKELLERLNILVFKHVPELEYTSVECGFFGIHYHALLENVTSIGQKSSVIRQIQRYCIYFINEECNNPLHYLNWLQESRWTITVNSIKEPSNVRFDENAYMFIITLQNDYTDAPIMDLCNSFHADSSEYLSPEDSAIYVYHWCYAQNIDPMKFVNDWINCLDGNLRKQEGKNALYFQGDSLCITSILNSIMEACGPLVKQFIYGLLGNEFRNDYGNKRVIALYEPYFDKYENRKELLMILEGNSPFFVWPASVVIICKEHGWKSNHKLKFDIKNRLIACYNNLKDFQPPPKKLHPDWLSLLPLATINFEQKHKHIIPECSGFTQSSSESEIKGSFDFLDPELIIDSPSSEPSSLGNYDFSLISPSKEASCAPVPQEIDNASEGKKNSDFLSPELIIDCPSSVSSSSGHFSSLMPPGKEDNPVLHMPVIQEINDDFSCLYMESSESENDKGNQNDLSLPGPSTNLPLNMHFSPKKNLQDSSDGIISSVKEGAPGCSRIKKMQNVIVGTQGCSWKRPAEE